MLKTSLVCAVVAVLLLPATEGCGGRGPETEILWDTYGVPHIFAPDAVGLFYAYGWAQMHNHGDLLLQIYGQARGKGAEYWGGQHLESDIRLRTLGVPGLAKEWLKSYSPGFRQNLEAFAQGINDYAASHRDQLDSAYAVVLPVTAEDVLSHTMNIFNVVWPGDHQSALPSLIGMWKDRGYTDFRQLFSGAGSNGWALGPSKTASGNAILLANPHLRWSGMYTFFEAQLTAPGINAYGATLVGFPLPVIAFNDSLGWTLTTNQYDGVDAYELTLSGDGYLYDGRVRQFEKEAFPVRMKNADGTVRENTVDVLKSVHGPVLATREGKALAVRYAGFDRPLIWEQQWKMLTADNLGEFEGALAMGQLTNQYVIYADKDGRVMIVDNGIRPVRPFGDYMTWFNVVRGDTSAAMWRGYHPYAEYPKVIDPPTGWLQNANDPIVQCTNPPAFNPSKYPAYMSSTMFFDEMSVAMPFYMLRPQRSVRMLSESGALSFQDVVRLKHSTRMELADRVLPDLLAAVDRQGDAKAKLAGEVLRNWDRCADAGSRGALLFCLWMSEMGGSPFAKTWDHRHPLETPSGLRDPALSVAALKAAAAKALNMYGSIDAPYGEYFRFRGDSVDLPGNGAVENFGAFRAVYYSDPGRDGRREANGGDTYVAVVEFSKPVKAGVLLGYGNSSVKGSTHRTDQLEFMSKKQLRDAWRTREEVERHLEKKEMLSAPPPRVGSD